MELIADRYTFGEDKKDLIINTLGQCYVDVSRSCVDLDQFGLNGVVAWFVYMDGKPHGPIKGFTWKNKKADDEMTIQEYFVSKDKSLFKKRIREKGFFPYRLAFQLDPWGKNEIKCCKFIGVFVFSKFLKDDLTAVEYRKISNKFYLPDLDSCLDDSFINQFCKKVPNYYYPIENMNLSTQTKTLLSKGGMKYAGDLLSLGIGSNTDTNKECFIELFKIFRGCGEKIDESNWQDILDEICLEKGFIRTNIQNYIYLTSKTNSQNYIVMQLDYCNGILRYGTNKISEFKSYHFDISNKEIIKEYIFYIIDNLK